MSHQDFVDVKPPTVESKPNMHHHHAGGGGAEASRVWEGSRGGCHAHEQVVRQQSAVSDEEAMRIAQSMIDIAAKQLYGLREFRTSEELIQKEICESESKLIRLFSKVLAVKSRHCADSLPPDLRDLPRTDQWLHIVGIANPISRKLQETLSLQKMLDMSTYELTQFLSQLRASHEDISRLTTALSKLRLATEHQLNGWKSSDVELHWSAAHCKSTSSSPYGGNSPKFAHHGPRPSTSSLPGDAVLGGAHCPQSPGLPFGAPAPYNGGYSNAGGGAYNAGTWGGGGGYGGVYSSGEYESPIAERRRHTRNTPPATPPVLKSSGGGSKGAGIPRFPTTPPPQIKMKKRVEGGTPLGAPLFQPLTKSKSHESQLANKISMGGDSVDGAKHTKKKPINLTLVGSSEAIMPRKRSTGGMDELTGGGGGARVSLSGQSSPLFMSPFRSPLFKTAAEAAGGAGGDGGSSKMHQLVVPPVSPLNLSGTRTMLHSIQHRFRSRLVLCSCDMCHKRVLFGRVCQLCQFQNKLVMSTCDLCRKHIFRGKVCRFCKAKFHRDCATKTAPSCGLPEKLVDMILRNMADDVSPDYKTRPDTLSDRVAMNHSVGGGGSPFQPPDSSSATSSCNSSSPSSPALAGGPPRPVSPARGGGKTPSSPAVGGGGQSRQRHRYYGGSSSDSRFQFPDTASTVQGEEDSCLGSSLSGTPTVAVTAAPTDIINTNTSNDSDKSDKTLIDSSSECMAVLDRLDSLESSEDSLSAQNWQRVNSISVTLKEWDIPYDELVVGDLIGVGRFGEVHKGSWHGDVAIKVLLLDPELDNHTQLQAFKLEVAMLRKTRHENLVLFMGACMTPPRLAIITSLCKGQTLYTQLHIRKDRFPMNRTVLIATQIAQGMGYLHAKGIIHKDLKTKNVFLENGKVVITDFGLLSVTKLCHGSRKGRWLTIPPGWLCYLAPEIMRSLRAGNQVEVDFPFSEASDVYAFGTVWYELLCGEWPFKREPPEAIIWQVGKGMKQSLSTLQASRDVKDVLMHCWAYKPKDRLDFRELLKTLDRLPKKRLARSPSHPIQLSRSAESVF